MRNVRTIYPLRFPAPICTFHIFCIIAYLFCRITIFYPLIPFMYFVPFTSLTSSTSAFRRCYRTSDQAKMAFGSIESSSKLIQDPSVDVWRLTALSSTPYGVMAFWMLIRWCLGVLWCSGSLTDLSFSRYPMCHWLRHGGIGKIGPSIPCSVTVCFSHFVFHISPCHCFYRIIAPLLFNRTLRTSSFILTPTPFQCACRYVRSCILTLLFLILLHIDLLTLLSPHHRVARDPRFERLPCSHSGTYADDCLVQRVASHRCYIVATCDRELRRRIRKVPGVPLMYIVKRRYAIERLPDQGAPVWTSTYSDVWITFSS